MIDNLAEYFSNEQEFYLDKISYKRIERNTQTKSYSLACTDSINTTVDEDNVKLIVTRLVRFEPNEVFEVMVSYGAVLEINKEKERDFEWEDIDLAKEFQQNGQFVTRNLMNRITLLIAEITSSYGQEPLILPPLVAKDSE